MNSYSSAKPTITNSISNVLGSTTTKPAQSIIGSNPSATRTSGSFFSSMSWTTIIFLFLFLFFFGFGIFVYLAKGTEDAIDFTIKLFMTIIQKITHLFGNESIDFSKETSSTTTISSSPQVSSSSNIDKHIKDDHGVSTNTDSKTNTVQASPSEPSKDMAKEDSLNKALNNAKPNLTQKNEPGYSADDSYSSIQMSKSSSKSGWCFIGEDRGFRSCIQVGENDKCMSGDIFPSQEICINPKLRS